MNTFSNEAILAALVSTIEHGDFGEPKNVADGLLEIARAIRRLAVAVEEQSEAGHK